MGAVGGGAGGVGGFADDSWPGAVPTGAGFERQAAPRPSMTAIAPAIIPGAPIGKPRWIMARS
jgi:hypothetical protein